MPGWYLGGSRVSSPGPNFCGLNLCRRLSLQCELPTGICAYPYPLGAEEELVEVYPASFTGDLTQTLLKMPSVATPSMLGDYTLGSSVTLYKVDGDECGQSTLDSKYKSYAEQFGGLKVGECKDVGYTKSTGKQTVEVPVIGSVTVETFVKP